MSQNISVKSGNRVRNEDGSIDYRVIYMSDKDSYVCDLNDRKLEIYFMPSKILLEKITSGELGIVQEETYIVDKDSLPENIRWVFERNLDIADMVTREYGPDYMGLCGKKSKPVINEVIDKYGISRVSFWAIIGRYIREGRTESSLLDKKYISKSGNVKKAYNYSKKTGRPREYKDSYGKNLTPVDHANFDKAIKQYLGSEVLTYQKAYETMLRLYYTKNVKQPDGSISLEYLPPDECPSFQQFYYYAKKKITPEQQKRAKQGADKYHNDSRVLTGSSMDDVNGPGDCVEIDANEMDVAIVSREDPSKAIGRPILYLAIDVYSRIILAVSIALDNNSVIALTNLFFNLRVDKIKLLAQYGIEFTNAAGYSIDDVWPTGVKPARVRTDHGSDFISNEFERILKELNITHKLVKAASGSYKAIVERLNGVLNKSYGFQVEGEGLIDPKHEIDHHKNATLNIDDITKIVLNFVIMHNTVQMKDYPRTADMIKKRIKSSPCELWKYGIKNRTSTGILPEMEEYMWKLMIPAKASFSRRGIKFADLYYLNREDERLWDDMVKAQNRQVKFDIRYDPRNITYVYYLRDGKIMTAELSPANNAQNSFIGMTYKEYMDIRREEKSLIAASEQERLQAKINYDENVSAIVGNARKRKKAAGVKTADTKDMRVNREREKQNVSSEHAFAAKVGLSGVDTTPEQTEPVQVTDEKKSSEKGIEQIDTTGMTSEEIQAWMVSNSRYMFEDLDEDDD